MTAPGIELAVAYVSIVGEDKGIARSAKKGIVEAQTYADAHPLDIKANVDVSHIKSVKIPVLADTSKFDRDARSAAGAADRTSSTITFATDLDTGGARTAMTAFRREMATQGAISIPVHLDIAGAASSAASSAALSEAIELSPDVTGVLDDLESQLASIDVSGLGDRLREQIGPVFEDVGGLVDVDIGFASAQLDELTRDRRIHIGLDVDWVPLLSALSALIAIRRMVEIHVGIPLDEILQFDTLLADLTRPRDARINLDVDQSSAAAVETRLDTIARNRRVELNVDSAALQGLTALGSHTVKLDVELNQGSLAAVNAAIDHIARDRTVTFHADLDAASAAGVDRLLDHLARRRTANFAASLDTAAAARMEILMGLLGRDRNVRFNSEGLSGVAGQADDAHRSLTAMSAIRFTGLVAGIGAIAPLLLGAVGAAGGAIGALGIGLAGLGPAAAAAAATVAVAVQGIGDAFTALSAAQDSAGSDGQAQAKAVAAAQEQVQSALENVETAQDSLTDAQKDARDAVEDIAQAYKDATDELEDYTFKVKDAALSEAEAKQALIEAREEFRTALPKDREKAYLRLQRADLRYQESVEKNKDTLAEANEALGKGVEGSDKVVAAKERAAEAEKKVADAQTAVIKAQENVAKAQQAVTDASNSSSSAADKAAAALAKLSPNAQEFVLAARGLVPEWDALKNSVQDSVFDGAATEIQNLATAALPTLKEGMVDVGTSINGLTKQFSAFWQAPENLAAVKSIFAGTANFIDGLGPGLQQATTGFLSFGQAFEPVANKVGAQIGGMLGQIGQAFTDAFNSGALTQLMSTFGDIMQGLGEGLKPLIAGLIEMGNIVGPTLGPLFKQLGTSLGALGGPLGTLGAAFATTLTALLPTLEKFIAELAGGLAPVLPVIGKLLDSVLGALIPMIEPLAQIAVVVGTALAQAITALAPALGPMAEAFAELVTVVAPLLPLFAQLISSIIQALAPALTTIFTALGPVIQQFADAFLPIIKDMAPLLAEVAKTIGNALAQALTDLAPILPPLIGAWGDLLRAIVPILPELATMISELLPPLTQLLVELAPVLVKLIELFTWLVSDVIIPVVVPAMHVFGDIVKWALETAVSVVSSAKDTLKSALSSIAGFFSDLGTVVSGVWDGIVHSIAVSVRKVGELLQKVPAVHIPGTDIDFGTGISTVGLTMVQWAAVNGAAKGGVATASGVARPVGGGRQVRGPGTGTSDSILAILNGRDPIALSDREFISTEEAYANGAPLLWALNRGWIPSPEFLAALVGGGIPGFAQGGVPGKAFAQSMDPVKYLMGGFARTGIDCSGMVSATVNSALGLEPFASRMSTVSEGQWLAAKGALPGLGGPGDISVGWYDHGGGAAGHTAMTLGDGTNVESNGTDGVVIGGPVGAASAMFDKHAHIPAAALRGGDLGGAATGTGTGAGGTLGGGGGSGGGGTSAGAGGGSGGAGGGAAAGNAQRVFVVNWPSGTFTDSAAASTPTPATTAGADGTSTSTLPTSISPPSLAVPSAPASTGRWWEADTPEHAAQQLGSNLASVDVPGRMGNALADFGNANLDQLLGDIGIRRQGGAIQALVSAITDAVTKAAAAEVQRQTQRQGLNANRFAGRP